MDTVERRPSDGRGDKCKGAWDIRVWCLQGIAITVLSWSTGWQEDEAEANK